MIRHLVGKKGRAGGHGMMAGGWMKLPSTDNGELQAFEERVIRRFLTLLGKKKSAALEPLIVPNAKEQTILK